MKTNSFIGALAADLQAPRRSLERMAVMSLVPIAALSGILVMLTLGFRSNLASLPGFEVTCVKLAISLPLALCGLAFALTLCRPGQNAAKVGLGLSLPVLVLLSLILWDLVHGGLDGWRARMVGHYGLECLFFVPLFSLLPLAAMVLLLRQGAVLRPRLAALAASLTATGIGASAYELHCTDDSPLFIGLWYVGGLLIVVALGQALVTRLLRW